MKATKYLIVLFGLCGLVTLVIPDHGRLPIEAALEQPAEFAQFLAWFLVPVVMGLLGILKPPQQAWQGAVALAGFAFGFVRLELWRVIPHIPDGALKNVSALLWMVGIVGGIVASLLALAKPEPRA